MRRTNFVGNSDEKNCERGADENGFGRAHTLNRFVKMILRKYVI